MSESAVELHTLLPHIAQVLSEGPNCILEAPPGSGKTTRVPLALLEAPWLAGQKILMLEPRRLAARSSARYMASLLGERVGQQVGYRVRHESQVGPQTRLEVVTEGVLTRLLQADPTLDGYGLVIFDEFHERSLQADLGLALCREVQQSLRDDLRLLLMSATLNGDALSALLEDAPVLRAVGRRFPVSLAYAAPPVNTPLWQHVVQSIRRLLAQESGSLLVFLPGVGEIRRVAEALAQESLPEQVSLAPLYGDLSPAEQDRAIQPSPLGQRKVVLATNLAETSLTIEGVRGVIDSGLARTPYFDPISGMSRLETRQISRASADQRAGRAGRLEPGYCLRLWHESDTARMAAELTPEILSADLAPLVLELAQWGTRDPLTLNWLNPPPAQAWLQAVQLLQELGALDKQGGITPHGKELARLPLAPRLAHMVLRGQAEGLGGLACVLAVLLSERDPLAGQTRDSDLILRVQALSGKRSLAEGRRRPLLQAAEQIAHLLHLKLAFAPLDAVGYLVGLAYPDRLAQRRPGGEARFRLANGRGAMLDNGDSLARENWLAVAQLDGNPREARIFLAAALSSEQLERLTTGLSQSHDEVHYELNTGRVQARRQQRFGALVLHERRLENPDPALVTQALLQGIRQRGLAQLPWTPALIQLQARVEVVRRFETDWPALDLLSLSENLADWLGPFLGDVRRLESIRSEMLQQGLEYALGYARLQALDQLAPTHWTVPTGTRIRLDYTQGDAPVLAVRLQEVFGLLDTPRLVQGRLPILLHLLSPAQRPVQVTRDLASFWRETYPEVKKELKGRYPKHHWPDDPLQADPVRGIKRRRPEA
ncbi:MAG: ATP-dependent helicase HrpB [Candidatus Sericytochromatia bacterium]